MIIWCDKCNVKPASKHRAECNFCDKSHPLCNDCYEEGIDNGTLKPIKQNKGILARMFG